MNLLENICNNKRLEVARQKEAVPLFHLKEVISSLSWAGVSFRQSLLDSQSGIIAEFKRRSPSKGWIHPDANIREIVKGYEDAGAAAISCLTDEQFFGGSFSDFNTARRLITKIPLLRKDFIIDEYQIYQSKVIGADIILLIAACLTKEEVEQFSKTAQQLGMEVLLEIHNQEELAYIQPYIDVVGINNRDLKTFTTDIQHTIELAQQIPAEYVKISESGISKPETVIHLRQEGFKGFLMGENFMKTENPAQTLKEFIAKVTAQ